MIDLNQLKTAAINAGSTDWKWWDSNSFRRLTFENGQHTRDGDALSGCVQQSDGHPDVLMARGVREFIELASPANILALINRLPPKCDGNHGGPRCADPECWNDSCTPATQEMDNAALPTETMVVVGFEAVSAFHDTAAYKQMSGCNGAAESARVCWAAMVAELPAGQSPAQDIAPSDAALLGIWEEATFAKHEPESVIWFARELRARYGQAAQPAASAEPVAWAFNRPGEQYKSFTTNPKADNLKRDELVPLYAAPVAAQPSVPDGWLPTSENINALPEPVRRYICELETNADPAGMVAENALLRDRDRWLEEAHKTWATDDRRCESCTLNGFTYCPHNLTPPADGQERHIRMHRGGLDESLATKKRIEPTLHAVHEYLREHGVTRPGPISIEYYAHDDRIGCDAYAVKVDGAICAWTDGQVQPDQSPPKFDIPPDWTGSAAEYETAVYRGETQGVMRTRIAPAQQDDDAKTLPRELLSLIGEYGSARASRNSEPYCLLCSERLIAGIKRYAAAQRKPVQQDADKADAQPSPELAWLYGHCKAIGMTCKSDSGKWEHDIALFTINLTDDLAKLQAQPDPVMASDDLDNDEIRSVFANGCGYSDWRGLAYLQPGNQMFINGCRALLKRIQPAIGDDVGRLDWLESQINARGAIHLHDGSKPYGHGLGLRPGNMKRSLRDAIDKAMQQGEQS